MPVDQTTLEKQREAKRILKKLRHHQQRVEDDKDDAVDCRSDALKTHFEQAKKNIEMSTTVDQALVDAQIFRKLGEYTRKQAEQLQSGLRSYDVKSFVDCLVANMHNVNSSGEEANDDDLVIDFVKLGDSVAGRYRTVPSLDFMYGNEPKQATAPPLERKTRQVKKGKNAVKPSELRMDEVEQTETDKQVAMMKKELQNRRQCNFWLFVIDPNDFTRSVENVFHSSFLIKDSWAQLDLKKDPPLIKYREQQDDDIPHGRDDDVDNVGPSEYIMEFDRLVWKEMIEKYDIRQCILPRNRDHHRNDERLQQMLQYESEGGQLASF